MGLIKARHEAIEMTSRRYQFFPRTFQWHGRCYNVEYVSRCWTTESRGYMNRHYFEVNCTEGKFVVWQDLSGNTWHIEV